MQSLARQKEQLDAQSIPWVLTDGLGRVTEVNQPFVDLCGFTLDEIKGMKPRDFLHGPMTEEDKKQELSSYLWNRLPVSTTITNYRKNKEPYRVHLTIFPLHQKPNREPVFFAVEFELGEDEKKLPSKKREILFQLTRELLGLKEDS